MFSFNSSSMVSFFYIQIPNLFGVYSCVWWSNFLFFQMATQFSWHYLLRSPSLIKQFKMSPLLYIKCLYIFGLTLDFLFWSLCLFTCQYHSALSIDTLWYVLTSDKVSPLVNFLFQCFPDYSCMFDFSVSTLV